MKISIIGLGSVGKAAELGLAEFHEVSGFDIDGRGNWQDVLSSELTFVCVNTDASEDSTLDKSGRGSHEFASGRVAYDREHR